MTGTQFLNKLRQKHVKAPLVNKEEVAEVKEEVKVEEPKPAKASKSKKAK